MRSLLLSIFATVTAIAQVTVSAPASNTYSASRTSRRSYQVAYQTAAGNSNNNLSVVYVHGGGGVGGSAVSPFISPSSCGSDLYIGCYLPHILGVNFYSVNHTEANNGQSGGYSASNLNVVTTSPCTVTSTTFNAVPWVAGDSLTVHTGTGSGTTLIKGGYQITSVSGGTATLDVCPATTTGAKTGKVRFTQGVYQWPAAQQDLSCFLPYLVHFQRGGNGTSSTGITPGNGKIVLLGHSQGAYIVLMAMLGYGQFDSLGPSGNQCEYTDDYRPFVRAAIGASTPWVDINLMYGDTNSTVQAYAEDLLGCIPGVVVSGGRDCSSNSSLMAIAGLKYQINRLGSAALTLPPMILRSGGSDTGVKEVDNAEVFATTLSSYGTPPYEVHAEANAAYTDAQCGVGVAGSPGTGCMPRGMNHDLDMFVYDTTPGKCFADGPKNGYTPNPCGSAGQFVMPALLQYIQAP